jgi:hypothetical protein
MPLAARRLNSGSLIAACTMSNRENGRYKSVAESHAPCMRTRGQTVVSRNRRHLRLAEVRLKTRVSGDRAGFRRCTR